MTTEANKKRTILVVDDAPENIASLCLFLKPTYRVKIALSGEKALSVVAKNLPDLILLDVVMPGMDGFEVCRRLKADPTTQGIPILFVSGNEIDQVKGEELGSAGVIQKPVNSTLLRSMISKNL